MAHEVEMLETVALIASERDRLMTALEGMPLEVWPSQANFILFRPLATSGFDLWNALVERSILVRDCTSWPMLENCLRVTVGTPSENDRFINAMREIL